MTTLVRAATDSSTMLRRNLLRMVRYPSMTLLLVGMPIIFLLLFVYVFGGALGAGMVSDGSGADGRAAYLDYVVPGILLMTVAAAANGTAVTVSMDMTTGLIARFKTMPIARTSVLTGHVLGNVIQSLLGVAVVLGVALLLGFRPSAGPLEWLGAVGVLALIAFAMTWLSVALGLVAKNVESASNLPMPLTFLPFLGSGFVPTDSMPAALAWFAEHQPFTPMIEAVRGLLAGTAVGSSGWLAVGWCALISALSHLWARRLYDRRTA